MRLCTRNETLLLITFVLFEFHLLNRGPASQTWLGLPGGGSCMPAPHSPVLGVDGPCGVLGMGVTAGPPSPARLNV